MLGDELEALEIGGGVGVIEYQNDAGNLIGHGGVIKGLTDAFGPLAGELDLDGIVAGEAVDAGAVVKADFHDAVVLVAPLFLIVLFGEVFGGLEGEGAC